MSELRRRPPSPNRIRSRQDRSCSVPRLPPVSRNSPPIEQIDRRSDQHGDLLPQNPRSVQVQGASGSGLFGQSREEGVSVAKARDSSEEIFGE